MLKKLLLLPSVILLSFLIRAWNSTSIALWHDEAFSALLIRMPFSEMMHRIALDVHPPFYYWLLRIWSDIFGHELVSLRGFSVFFGVATVVMLYWLVKDIFNSHKLALGAAALLAVNPFHIQYSLEARMYTLGTFLIVLTSWLLVKALRANKWKYWVLFGVFTAAVALTHYFLLFSIAAQGLFVLVWWFKKNRPLFAWQNLRWLWSYIIALILYIPWLPIFLKQFGQVQENYWIPEMTVWSVMSTIWKILLGGFSSASDTVLIVSSLVFAGIFIFYILKYRKLEYQHLTFMSLVPFVLAILVSIQTSLFLDRYFIFTSVFITAVVAISLLTIKYKQVGAGILALLVLFSIVSYARGYEKLNVADKPGMKAASQYIFNHYPLQCSQNAPQADPSDKIVVSSTFIYFSYQYYYELYRQPNPSAVPSYACELVMAPEPKLYLGDVTQVKQLPHFSGTALLENDDFTGPLDSYAEKGDTVWLLWTTGFGGSKPDVPAHWQQVEEQKFPDVFQHRGDIFITRYSI